MGVPGDYRGGAGNRKLRVAPEDADRNPTTTETSQILGLNEASAWSLTTEHFVDLAALPSPITAILTEALSGVVNVSSATLITTAGWPL